MNNSNSPSQSASRPILKLKISARKSPREPKTPPASQAKNPNKFKPGARWE
jgi:hypothetical protein